MICFNEHGIRSALSARSATVSGSASFRADMSPHTPVVQVAAIYPMGLTTGGIQDEMCRAGCIPALVGLMMVGHERPVARIATSAIMALCYQHPGNRRAVREAGGIQPLIRLLAVSPPHPITEKAAWALSNLCAGCSPNQVLA